MPASVRCPGLTVRGTCSLFMLGSPLDESSFGVRLNPPKCWDPVETDNLGKRKLPHHDSVVGISKGDVLLNVQTKDVPKFALPGKRNPGQFEKGEEDGLNLGIGAAVASL